jgi:hypothetical protein
MIGTSFVFFLLLAVIWAFASDALRPHYASPGHLTDAEIAAFDRYDVLDKVGRGVGLAADIGFILALRAFMMKKTPFLNPVSARSLSAGSPVYAPGSKTACDQCGSPVPSGFYLEKSPDSRYLCETCRSPL